MDNRFRTAGLKLLRDQAGLVKAEIEVLDYLIHYDNQHRPQTYLWHVETIRHDDPFIENVIMSIMIKSTNNGLVPVLERLKEQLSDVFEGEILRDIPVDGAHAQP